jgi:hypothetical protein
MRWELMGTYEPLEQFKRPSRNRRLQASSRYKDPSIVLFATAKCRLR